MRGVVNVFDLSGRAGEDFELHAAIRLVLLVGDGVGSLGRSLPEIFGNQSILLDAFAYEVGNDCDRTPVGELQIEILRFHVGPRALPLL